MRRALITLLALATLAGCNKQPSVSLTNASPEEVAKAVGAGSATILNPGKWETTAQITDLTMPGMEKLPPQFAEQMKAKMLETHVTSSCMTPEQAKKPDASVLAGKTGGACTFSNFTMAGGAIDATMTCPRQEGGMTMHMTGTFTPDSVNENAEMTGSGPQGEMHMKMHVTARRVGECDGKENP